MDKNLAPIKQRALQYVDFKNIKRGVFFKEVHVSPSNFRGDSLKSELKGDTIAKILTKYSDLSAEWFTTGVGEMLKSNIVKTEALPFDITNNSYKPIPLVNVAAAAGFGSAAFNIKQEDVKDYYVIPKFKYNKIDFMIEVRGSSMYPKYNSGDVIACTILKENRFIQWNKVHVIATREQGLLVKRVKKGDTPNCISAVSDNKDYDPFFIPKEEITGLAVVVGVIRLE